MFDQAGKVLDIKKASMRAIDKAKPIIVDHHHTLILEKCLTKEEVSDAIDALKCNKSSNVDGLATKLFNMYKYVLVDPLLAVWQEATQFGALPRRSMKA